jgi:hypothetical protein
VAEGEHYESAEKWRDEAVRRFGADPLGWRFVCPVCHSEMSVDDYRKAGAPEDAIAYSCVGRYQTSPREAFDGSGPGPCNYAGGGLFRLNPVVVDGHRLFAFAEVERG